MTDLVETLRETFKRRRYEGDAEYHPDFDLFDVAADEIEKLRRKIEAISQVAGKASIDGVTFAQETVGDGSGAFATITCASQKLCWVGGGGGLLFRFDGTDDDVVGPTGGDTSGANSIKLEPPRLYTASV